MKKRTMLCVVAVLLSVMFVISGSALLLSDSTEGNEREQPTKNIISYKHPIPQNEGDPDDLGGGLRNTY